MEATKKINIINLFSIIILSFFLVACELEEDASISTPASGSAIEGSTKELDPQSQDNSNQEELIFAPNIEITELNERTATITWAKEEDAVAYIIFLKENNLKKYISTVRAKKSKFKLKNLSPGTNYEVSVRKMNIEGQTNTDPTWKSFVTLSFPTYENNWSLEAEGSQVVTLPSSIDLMKGKKVALSIWFRTSLKQNDARLISLKHNASKTALNINVDKNSVNLGYRNNSGNYFKLEHEMDYDDDLWHNVVAVYNNKNYFLYIDGELKAQVSDSFLGVGDYPAIIGGYKQSQNTFKGYLDEASIWKGALSKKQVNELYNNGNSTDLNLHSKWRNIKAWYRFNQNTNDSMNEFHGSGSNIEEQSYSQEAI